jgi:hypothetical protein
MSQPPTRRILVALHPGDDLENALLCAAAFAAELHGELAGLFLEDQALFDLTEFAAVEVSRATGSTRLLDASALERDLRAGAELARRRISGLAAESRVAWSFEVRRGPAGDTVLEAMHGAQLVVISRGAFDPLGMETRGSTSGPVVALLDRGPGEAATLETALGAARRIGAPLLALLIHERTPEQIAEIQTRGARAGVPMRLRTSLGEPAELTAALAAAGGRLLVLDAGGAGTERGELRRLLAAARCDAVLVAAP